MSACPILFDVGRQEPFIPLSNFPDLRVTPYKSDDLGDMVLLCNDEAIGKWAKRRPYPYGIADAKWFIDTFKQANEEALKALKPWFCTTPGATSAGVGEISSSSPTIEGTGCLLPGALDTGSQAIDPSPSHAIAPPPRAIPFGALRYVPTQPLAPNSLGDMVSLRPNELVGMFHLFPYEREGFSGSEILSQPPNEQIWEVAYDVLPIIGGRGIGKAMVKAGLKYADWLGVGKVVAHVQIDNTFSCSLLRSCGFVIERLFTQPWPENKGGGKRELYQWARTHPGQSQTLSI